MPISIGLFTKSLWLGLGYPIVHEKNAPRGKPLETRARILLEIMKGPLSRTRLKEKLSDLSTKTIDYHVQRAKDSLLNLKIVKEQNNRLKLNIKEPENLVKIIEILTAHKELGGIVQKSLDTAFVDCFTSVFGNDIDVQREFGRKESSVFALSVISFHFYQLRKELDYYEPSSITSENYDRSEKIYDEITPVIITFAGTVLWGLSQRLKVYYILKVLGNVWRAHDCYIINKKKEDGDIDITVESEFTIERSKKLNGDLDCQLFNFTNWYTKPWRIEQEVNDLMPMFPELLEYFYQKIISEPLFMKPVLPFEFTDLKIFPDSSDFSNPSKRGAYSALNISEPLPLFRKPPFMLLDPEIFSNLGAYSTLFNISLLLRNMEADMVEDVRYNPFESGLISTLSNKLSEGKYPEPPDGVLRLNIVNEEYIKLRLERAEDWLSGKFWGNIVDLDETK